MQCLEPGGGDQPELCPNSGTSSRVARPTTATRSAQSTVRWYARGRPSLSRHERSQGRSLPAGPTARLAAVQTISVTVDPKHFERLAANPARALAELIWNALDADADKIDV